ncbi:MAG: helix-turn-helix transcriptional regulator [Xanthomonadales bacterium]|nr:helix-turn-helix transcriptional regulator [Xanthomonadales bacterium]
MGISDDASRTVSSAISPALKISLRIRQARRKAKLSQQFLGDTLGVQRSAVSNWESNRSINPSLQNLIGIAIATDVSFEWLATGRGKMHPAHDPYENIVAADIEWVESAQERELLERFRRASPRAQNTVLELMNILSPVHRGKGKR